MNRYMRKYANRKKNSANSFVSYNKHCMYLLIYVVTTIPCCRCYQYKKSIKNIYNDQSVVQNTEFLECHIPDVYKT